MSHDRKMNRTTNISNHRRRKEQEEEKKTAEREMVLEISLFSGDQFILWRSVYSLEISLFSGDQFIL